MKFFSEREKKIIFKNFKKEMIFDLDEKILKWRS